MAAVTLGAHFLYETIPECIARVSISETLDAGIIMKSVQGTPSRFGVSVEENMIKYSHRNCLLHDFSKFSGLPRSEVAGKLNKTFGRNRKGFKTEVLVSREKHFVLV